MALTEQTAASCSGQVPVSKGLISKIHNMTWLKNSPLPDQSDSDEKMSKNKNRKPKQNGKGRASVQHVLTDNGGGASASGNVWKGDKNSGAELFPNANATSVAEPTEEEQMRWAMEEGKKMQEATLRTTADIDEQKDCDNDYWDKRQSNLPEPEAEKAGTGAKPADQKDDSAGKRTTAGQIRDCPPGRCVVGRNNGNVENSVREIEASGPVRDNKRYGDKFGRAERPPGGRGSGPREQQTQRRTNEFARRQQQPDRHHFYRKEEQPQPVRQTDVDQKLAILKNDDKPEVAAAAAASAAVETCSKEPAEEKLRLTGFHSRSNRPSPEDEDDSEITAPPVAPGDFSHQLETRPTCNRIYNAPPGLTLNKPPIGNLASNPESQRAYDQLAIYDPLLHRLLVQKHIDDRSSSFNDCRVAPVDSDNRRHRQQLQQSQEEEEEEQGQQDWEAMPQQQQSEVYGHGAPPSAAYLVMVDCNGQPPRVIPLHGLMDTMSLNPNAACYQPQQQQLPPVVGDNQMGNAIRVPQTPRGTAPSHRTPDFPMDYQSPLGPRYYDNPHENLRAPECRLLPHQYEQTSSTFTVPPGGRQHHHHHQQQQQQQHQQQQVQFPSGYLNMVPMPRGPRPAPPHRQFANPPGIPGSQRGNFRQRQPRQETMPNMERLPR